MEKTNFENLRVYQLAEALADGIWKVVVNWDYLAKNTIGKQMGRAADSIGANIAEGTGRGTLQENRRFIRMARGSLYETQHWLRRSYKRTLLSKEQIESLRCTIEQLSPALNADFRAINTAAQSQKNKAQRIKNKAPSSKG